MAGDCPDHNFRESFLSCQFYKPEHGSLMSMIDDIKFDVESLAGEVSKVSGGLCDTEIEESNKLEKTLTELEKQNVRLEAALQASDHEMKKLNNKLKSRNEDLLSQIKNMEQTITEKEKRITELGGIVTELSHKKQEFQKCTECCMCKDFKRSRDAQMCELRYQLDQANRKCESLLEDVEKSRKLERNLLSEVRKLNDELQESKRKCGDFQSHKGRLTVLLKSQELSRMELTKKYEIMEQNYDDQAKKLRAAGTQLGALQERFNFLEQRNDEHNMERNLLHDEVLSLKEKEAGLLGKQKSMQDQLLNIEKELFTAHNVIKEQQCILQRKDIAFKDMSKHGEETSTDLKIRLENVVEDYKRLVEEYEKMKEIRRENEKIIESFRKWKDAQLKSDEATRIRLSEYEKHINLLLEEKQLFLEQFRDLHRDYNLLQHELDRLKICKTGITTPAIKYSENSVNSSISNRMETLRRTSLRLSEQTNSIQLEDTSRASFGVLKSPTDQLT